MNEVHAYFMNPDWMVGICNEERGGEEDRKIGRKRKPVIFT